MKIKLFVVAVLLLLSVGSAIAIQDIAINKIPSNNPVISQLVLVEGNPATMSANIKNGKLHIYDQLHTTRWVKLNRNELINNIDGFNGHSVGLTHISDSGNVEHWIQQLGFIDENGYYTIELEFSEVIISGFTGYSEWDVNGINNNYVLPVPNTTSYNVTITHNVAPLENLTNSAIALNYDNSGTNDLEKARDGNTGVNAWHTSDDTGGSIGYNFSSNINISRIGFYSIAVTERVKNFTVKQNISGTWTKVPITSVANNTILINTDEGQASNANGWNTVNFNTITTDAVRLTFTDTWNIGDANAGISEMYMYEIQNGTSSITASVVGDSETHIYNTTDQRTFTLTPTSANNNVTFTTSSSDYDILVKAYWTEDTIKYSETVSNGYANTTIQYTPSYNITNGVLNTTYSLIDFSAHDYVSSLECIVDGVNSNSNASRSIEDVNVSIVNFDTSLHWINFSVAYNPPPSLFSPNDTSTLTYTYPPLNHDVVLDWNATTGQYKYTVVDFYSGAVITSGTTTTDTKTVSLPSGHYKWWINGYDDVFGEYSISSEIRSFAVADTYSYNGTVIHGVVYENIQGVETPLNAAVVNIWNSTWSGSALTGVNGYFVFLNIHNSTYSMRATKTGYLDSNIELVTPSFNETLTRNILMQDDSGAGSQYVDHYVKFIVKSWYGTVYSGVEVNVYIGDAVIPQHTGDTGTDGSIAFELDENQEYRFTFIDVTQGINEERTLYPKESEYEIIVFGANLIPDDPASSDILFGGYGQSINLTHGYINVSFEDLSETTTLAELWINDTNQTTLYYFNTTDSEKAWSQVVDGGNASYVVVFKLDNTELSEPLVIIRTIKFDDTINVNLGLDEGWKYQLIAVLIISVIALLGSALNAEKMAVVTVLVGWLMVFFGWLQAGATIPEQITLGLMMLFATLIAFGSVIRKGDER